MEVKGERVVFDNGSATEAINSEDKGYDSTNDDGSFVETDHKGDDAMDSNGSSVESEDKGDDEMNDSTDVTMIRGAFGD